MALTTLHTGIFTLILSGSMYGQAPPSPNSFDTQMWGVGEYLIYESSNGELDSVAIESALTIHGRHYTQSWTYSLSYPYRDRKAHWIARFDSAGTYYLVLPDSIEQPFLLTEVGAKFKFDGWKTEVIARLATYQLGDKEFKDVIILQHHAQDDNGDPLPTKIVYAAGIGWIELENRLEHVRLIRFGKR